MPVCRKQKIPTREVIEAFARVNERLRRNPLGCYGAAKYKYRFNFLGYKHECEPCRHFQTCWRIDMDPNGCLVILYELEELT